MPAHARGQIPVMDQRLVVESPQIREVVDPILARARPKRARVRCKNRESKQTLQGFVQAPGAFIAQRACRTGKKKEKEKREGKDDPIHSESQWFLNFLFISNFPVFFYKHSHSPGDPSSQLHVARFIPRTRERRNHSVHLPSQLTGYCVHCPPYQPQI